jgi:hypothetical protein
MTPAKDDRRATIRHHSYRIDLPFDKTLHVSNKMLVHLLRIKDSCKRLLSKRVLRIETDTHEAQLDTDCLNDQSRLALSRHRWN